MTRTEELEYYEEHGLLSYGEALELFVRRHPLVSLVIGILFTAVVAL